MSEQVDYIGQLSKQTSERRALLVSFAYALPTGVSVSSCSVAAYKLPDGDLDNSVLSSTSATITGAYASVYAIEGTDRTRYRITFTATLSDTQIIQEDILMIVENASSVLD